MNDIIIRVQSLPSGGYKVVLMSNDKLTTKEILAVGNITVSSWGKQISDNEYLWINPDSSLPKFIGSELWQRIIIKSIEKEILFDIL
jgi:hypothetical protein